MNEQTTRYRNGINKWTDEEQIVTAENCPGEYWYPMVNERRVHKDHYEPYQRGSEAWRKAANRALESLARNYFERR